MTPHEKLQITGKIALLRNEIKELDVRIRGRQNAIREATSIIYRVSELAEHVPDLEEAVKGYCVAFQRWREAHDELTRMENEL